MIPATYNTDTSCHGGLVCTGDQARLKQARMVVTRSDGLHPGRVCNIVNPDVYLHTSFGSPVLSQ